MEDPSFAEAMGNNNAHYISVDPSVIAHKIDSTASDRVIEKYTPNTVIAVQYDILTLKTIEERTSVETILAFNNVSILFTQETRNTKLGIY